MSEDSPPNPAVATAAQRRAAARASVGASAHSAPGEAHPVLTVIIWLVAATWTDWGPGGVLVYVANLAAVTAAWGAGLLVWGAWQRRREPACLARAWHEQGGARRVRSAAIAVVLLSMAAALYTGWKSRVGQTIPFAFDAALAHADAALWVPWFNACVAEVLRSPYGPAVHDALVLFYYPVTAAVAALAGVALAWAPASETRARLLTTSVGAVLGLGVLVAGAVPAAGPLFLEHAAPDLAPTFAPLLSALADAGGTMQAIRGALLAGHATLSTRAGAGISAMPSMHVTGVALAALTGHALRWPRAVRWPLYLAAALTWVASVALAMHYAVDGLVSVAGVWGMWQVAGRRGRA